ncbi:tyrosine-protein phosphatase [Streptacidiphilus monticola]|uniref:Tyrosine-protein phosphatase n=1 Tax=Streptacidiphilus monticola TaxID=2161674 RepID=A0ABW1FVF4_9ACTN
MTTTQPVHVRDIPFERLHNVRDLGGWRGADGRAVAFGLLYRGDSLGKLVPGSEDERTFLGLGVRTVVDLRYPWEIEPAGRVPAYPGLAYHNLSIEHRPYDQPALGADVDPGPFLAERYREVAEDGVAEIRQVLELVADPGSGPLLFHCASGKDRTGLVAALVLTLLGVPEADVVAEFALTERAREALIGQWSEGHGGQVPGWPGYGRTPAGVITRLYAGLRADYGSVEGYVAQRLGLDAQFTAALRERLLVE